MMVFREPLGVCFDCRNRPAGAGLVSAHAAISDAFCRGGSRTALNVFDSIRSGQFVNRPYTADRSLVRLNSEAKA